MNNVNAPTDITFPILAGEIASAAEARLQNQSRSAETLMVEKLLPRTVQIIWSQDKDCRNLTKQIPAADRERVFGLIGQTLWSQPGTFGGQRIEQMLIGLGLPVDDADKVASNVLKYSRYSMSVVNLVRHYRSAVSSVFDILSMDRFETRYLNQPGIENDLLSKWQQEIKDLGSTELKNSADLDYWLKELEDFMAEVLSARAAARKRPAGAIDLSSNERRVDFGRSTAMAYVRRYGRFLTQEFDQVNLSGRYAQSTRPEEASILIQLGNLELELKKPDAEAFEKFAAYYELRNRRMASAKDRLTRGAFPARRQGYEDYFVNQLKLEGRELTIQNYPEKVSKDLTEQLIRMLDAQLEIDSKSSLFEGKVSRDGQTLWVNLERPNQKDVSKLKQLLPKIVSP